MAAGTCEAGPGSGGDARPRQSVAGVPNRLLREVYPHSEGPAPPPGFADFTAARTGQDKALRKDRVPPIPLGPSKPDRSREPAAGCPWNPPMHREHDIKNILAGADLSEFSRRAAQRESRHVLEQCFCDVLIVIRPTPDEPALDPREQAG